jgi:hypothetical protein
VTAARSTYRGVLSDPGPGVGMTLLPSLLLHVPVVLMLAFGTMGEKAQPPITRDVFMVSAVVLPKSKALPKKAAAPKPPPAGEAGTKPEPPPLPNELVLKQKKAKDAEGKKVEPKQEPTPKDPPKKRDLSSLIARVEEEADEVVFETSPDGVEGATPSEDLRARFGRQLSPYERLVADAIKANWHPTAMQMPVPEDLWAVVSFTIEENGALSGPAMEQGSGDWSYDSSCLRAVTQTRRVQPPGPKDKRRVMLGFSPKDKP